MTRKAPPSSKALLSESALPCVWMTAGLVSYKLCDREYDCEHCPFDAALHGGDPELPSPPVSRASHSPWEWRCDRRYHRSHGWVMATKGGRLRFGLDPFAVHLLDRVTAVVLPAAPSPVHRGRPVCWLMDDAELIPLPAPISGTVLRVNETVQHSPSLITTSPYDDGWLLEIRGEGDLEQQPELVCAAEWQEHTMRQLEELHQRAACHVSAVAQGVGPTLADGGEPITDLRGLLGVERYHRLILEFLA